MRLKSLKVQGFKSFADATTVEFHDGITAVVGPNGCGKSNISDAIRWVLGEQRPTAIRGAKMEEAIFQGSVNRRPVNRGSVSLTVSNEDGALPIAYEEVEIGRQVFRDGGSEYSINRSSVRLKDIVELYRDTGLGANAYAMIEQRMVDAILSNRNEERRSLFEEAAGIGKYKDRRKSATRRLERAEMDLQRLDDVIAEIQTKVRSLARQKGKAQRYDEFRKRRLDVEVEVVRHRLETLSARLKSVTENLEGDVQTGQGMVVELASSEAEYEALRLSKIEAEKQRMTEVASLGEVRETLVRWERDLAVSDERVAYASRRLAQIEDESAEAQGQAAKLQENEVELETSLKSIHDELGRAKSDAADRSEDAEQVRVRLEESRSRFDAVESQGREIARRVAQLEGDAESADAQAAELERRLEQITNELSAAADTISDLESQGDLFSRELVSVTEALESARSDADLRLQELEVARPAFEIARSERRSAVERLASLTARRDALESLARDREGVDPVVKALLESELSGVLGVLSDFIDAGDGSIETVESFLGPLTTAVVVQDVKALDLALQWFGTSWRNGGGLILLPLDRVPDFSSVGREPGLLGQVEVSGAGAPWVEALLHGVSKSEGSGEMTVTERDGVVRVGNPSGGSSVLERKKILDKVLVDCEEAESENKAASSKAELAEKSLHAAEDALEASREALRVAEDIHRKAQSDLDAQEDHRGRMDRLRDEFARQLEGARAARSRALERADEAREDREVFLEQEAGLHGEREKARAEVHSVQEEWELARAEEARLAVNVARLEGDGKRLSDRLSTISSSRGQAAERVKSLDAEKSDLHDEQAAAHALRKEGDEATERLFAERTEAEAKVRRHDEALQSISEDLETSERRVREARTKERAASDRRHELELEKQELSGSVRRIRERLENEWGRPLDVLLEEAVPVDGEPEELESELEDIVSALERIGPVNMLAVEEHEEESARLEFLTEQRSDLVEARDDLRSAIREINKTATELFSETFENIRENFRMTFLRLFEGGEADLWLMDPDDPLESPIEIHASPRGKKTQRIDLLSGGERALTSLSLLFGIYLVKPSPFCVFDEVDAPLDEANIGRFIRLLQEFSEETQFVVITHNPRTIEAADWIYGVTMEEPGVSSVVGVKLDEALEAAGAA